MTDEDEELFRFENDHQHSYDTGMLIGHLSGRGISAIQELQNDIDYTPVVRIEIEGQLPVWVRVLSR